ncbi:MAG: hypothetical protein HOM11_15235 [Methylococcales bacterium]|jgi:hypothetical protein|nr:hypothetical protein [Methylococcales bacterium]MBT7445912.1 hypothetical protein [Methylococcales bacterium]
MAPIKTYFDLFLCLWHKKGRLLLISTILTVILSFLWFTRTPVYEVLMQVGIGSKLNFHANEVYWVEELAVFYRDLAENPNVMRTSPVEDVVSLFCRADTLLKATHKCEEVATDIIARHDVLIENSMVLARKQVAALKMTIQSTEAALALMKQQNPVDVLKVAEMSEQHSKNINVLGRTTDVLNGRGVIRTRIVKPARSTSILNSISPVVFVVFLGVISIFFVLAGFLLFLAVSWFRQQASLQQAKT